MSPELELVLRRHWMVVVAVAMLAVLSIVNLFWYRPAADRYTRTIQRATELGMPLDPNHVPRLMPPRLFALIADNSLPSGQAQQAADSGSLTAEFLGELTERLGRRNITALVTEPGPVSQDEHTVQLRAHLRVRCRFSDFVLLLDDFAGDDHLFGVDRFNIVPDPSGAVLVELWMSRLVLKTETQP